MPQGRPGSGAGDGLERLGLTIRDAETGEVVDGLSGRTLFVDQGGANAGSRVVSGGRLSPEAIRAALDALDALEADMPDFTRSLRGSLAELMGRADASDPAGALGFDAQAFARAVCALEAGDATRQGFVDAARIYESLDQSGLTTEEAAIAKARVAELMAAGQSDISSANLQAAVESFSSLQSSGGCVPAVPSQPASDNGLARR